MRVRIPPPAPSDHPVEALQTDPSSRIVTLEPLILKSFDDSRLSDILENRAQRFGDIYSAGDDRLKRKRGTQLEEGPSVKAKTHSKPRRPSAASGLRSLGSGSWLTPCTATWTRHMSMNESAICELLRAKGREMFDVPRVANYTGDQFAKHKEANELVRDLERYPHAFVIGCIMDRRVQTERAWCIPYRLAQRIGSFDFGRLRELSSADLRRHMREPSPLHRFPEEMAKNLDAAIQLITEEYQGNANNIWADCPSSAALVYRFLQFRGVGSKIATMAANSLVRDFKVPVSDTFSIDISPDVLVRRVFERLGLVPEQASPEQVIYRARELNPEFPGLMDLPCWQIGRKWCRPKNPLCNKCFMKEVCPATLHDG